MTQVASNLLSLEGTVRRTRTNGGDYALVIARALDGLADVRVMEVTLAADAVGVALDLGTVTTPEVLIIKTPQLIGLHLNGLAAPEVPCGSYLVLFDTTVSSVHFDNDLVAGTPCLIEVWIATT